MFYFLQDAIFRTLAAILHLGNIEFAPGKYSASKIKDSPSNFHLQMAENLFMYVFSLHRLMIFVGGNIPFFLHNCCFSRNFGFSNCVD
jgi:hypothetical protein